MLFLRLSQLNHLATMEDTSVSNTFTQPRTVPELYFTVFNSLSKEDQHKFLQKLHEVTGTSYCSYPIGKPEDFITHKGQYIGDLFCKRTCYLYLMRFMDTVTPALVDRAYHIFGKLIEIGCDIESDVVILPTAWEIGMQLYRNGLNRLPVEEMFGTTKLEIGCTHKKLKFLDVLLNEETFLEFEANWILPEVIV